jgi:hypothetical protein
LDDNQLEVSAFFIDDEVYRFVGDVIVARRI